MIPPTFSKPKQDWQTQRKAGIRTTTRLRLVEGVKDRSSYMVPVNDKFQALKPPGFWIDCPKDKASFKLWLIANNRKV